MFVFFRMSGIRARLVELVAPIGVKNRLVRGWRIWRAFGNIGGDAEKALTDAPDFFLVIDIGEVVDGGEIDMKGERGAGGVVFELSAVEFQTVAADGNVLAGDIKKTASQFKIVVLKKDVADDSETGGRERSIGERESGMSVITAGEIEKRFGVLGSGKRSDGVEPIEAAELGMALLIETRERSEVGFDAETIRRRLGDTLLD
jgi:hypothetical protein